jgi:hypothetical protein
MDTTAEKMIDDLIRMCARQKWDCLLAMIIPTPQSYNNLDENFQRWIREVEGKRGALHFRWVRFVPREYDGPTTACYVLIDGLSSENGSHWALRWTAIDGNDDSRSCPLYVSRKGGKSLTRLLRDLLNKKDFRNCNVELRFGPTTTQLKAGAGS